MVFAMWAREGLWSEEGELEWSKAPGAGEDREQWVFPEAGVTRFS